MKEFKTQKEKILDRALYTIGKKGSLNISVRDIAAEADVNVAAINYYFDTKAKMMEQVELLFVDNFQEVYSILEDFQLDEEQRLITWMNEIMIYTYHYPGIMVILNEKMKKSDTNDMWKCLHESLGEKSEILRDLISKVSGVSDETQLRFMEISAISSLVYPAIVHPDTSLIKIVDFASSEKREQYVKFILKQMKGCTK